MRNGARSRCGGGSSRRVRLPGGHAPTSWSCSSASRASLVAVISFRSSIFINALALALAAGGCSQVRGRKQITEANELYKRGRYGEAVAAFEVAEGLVPELPTLWLNKGYTCRQLIA